MPATCTELLQSRRLVHENSIELLYVVDGTADEAAALAAVLATAPATYTFDGTGGSGSGSGSGAVELLRQAPELEPIYVDAGAGTGRWEARVPYRPIGSVRPPQPDESTFAFDTTGGQQKVTQARQNMNRYPATAPNFHGGISYDPESRKFEGCEITVPVYHFTETHYKTPTFVDTDYKKAVMQLTGRQNDAAFRGFSASEVLFLGVTGARRGRHASDLWELTFHFAVSENRTNFTLGGISVGRKDGWDLMWVLYEDDVDTSAKARVKKPKGVYVEQVYLTGDFSTLKIGTNEL